MAMHTSRGHTGPRRPAVQLQGGPAFLQGAPQLSTPVAGWLHAWMGQLFGVGLHGGHAGPAVTQVVQPFQPATDGPQSEGLVATQAPGLQVEHAGPVVVQLAQPFQPATDAPHRPARATQAPGVHPE